MGGRLAAARARRLRSAPRGGRAALVLDSRSRSSSSTAPARVVWAYGADGVPSADRAADDRRQRAGGALPRGARDPTLYRVHERPGDVERLVDQSGVARCADAAGARPAHDAQQAAEVVGEARARRRDWIGAGGRGARALPRSCARSSRHYAIATAGMPGCAPTLLSLHLADPPLSRPGLPPGAAAARRGRAGARASWVAAAGPWTSAREREAMMIERDADDVARCFLLARARRRSGGRVFDGEIVGLIGAGAFVAFGDDGLRGDAPGPPDARTTGGSSTSRARCSSERAAARRCGSATVTVRVGGSTRRGVGWICCLPIPARLEVTVGERERE